MYILYIIYPMYILIYIHINGWDNVSFTYFELQRYEHSKEYRSCRRKPHIACSYLKAGTLEIGT